MLHHSNWSSTLSISSDPMRSLPFSYWTKYFPNTLCNILFFQPQIKIVMRNLSMGFMCIGNCKRIQSYEERKDPFLILLNDDLKIGSKYLVILLQLQIHMKPIDKFLIIMSPLCIHYDFQRVWSNDRCVFSLLSFFSFNLIRGRTPGVFQPNFVFVTIRHTIKNSVELYCTGISFR